MKSGILHRILALVLILISIFCVSGFARHYKPQKHKGYKKKETILLHGESLARFYNKKIGIGIKDSDVAIRNLFDLAESAYYKKISERTSKESEALSIVEAASLHFFRTIFHDSLVLQSSQISVLIFGGVMSAGGSFLKSILEESALRFNNSKKLKLIFSQMGDERAILGAVVYIASIFNCKDDNDYAIGIDIGGTNIRIGVIKLSNFSVAKKLIKEPVFADGKDKNIMNGLIPGMKKVAESIKSGNGSNGSNKNNNELLGIQKIIGSALIKRMCAMINVAKKDYKIKFIAISSAGDINEYGFFDHVYKLPFTGVNLKLEMERILKIPVFIANDIDCAAFGEKKFGSLKKYNRFIVAGLGTGLGIKYFEFNANSIRIQDILKKIKVRELVRYF